MQILLILLISYVLLCIFVYFYQERMIFFPKKLAADYKFQFEEPYEEISIPVDGIKLNGLLLKADSSKGLVFYLHGNAGGLDSWGEIAGTYTSLGYDVFMLDYRGYGKSGGRILNEEQFYADVQLAYQKLKERYRENQTIIVGYSIGTGAASWLASSNNPRMLILQAPYYSLKDMMRKNYTYLPSFLLKYNFENYKHLQTIKAPVYIFHGKNDEVIYTGSSEKLKPFLKPTDSVMIIEGMGHNGMNEDAVYKHEVEKLLKE
jgi:alpha-beta hydrolase superfamily lysophospholipase